MSSETKACTKCGKELPLSEFYFHKVLGKPRAECKRCHYAQCSEWCAAHKEERRKMARARRNANIEKERKREKAWREKNREKVIAADRKWRATHRAEYLLRQNEYRRKNIERTKKYRRASDLKKHYGITVEQYDAMLCAQSGRCAICSRAPEGRGLFVDHDHSNGRLRELLCHKCNALLGMASDSEPVLLSAIEYLRRHRWRVAA